MSFLDSLEHNIQARSYFGEIPLTYRYTAGVAGEKFLRALKEGKFFGTRCPRCAYTYFPARMYCERCMKQLDEAAWVEVGPQGELLSFTAVYVDLDGKHLEKPQWAALIRLDGTSGAFVHYINVSRPEALKAGMRVKIVLKPAKERVGSIRDIAYFESL
jgi:hypothetical protein